MKKIIALLLVFTFGLSSCEKDDICDANTPTTSRMLISFFYADRTSVAKSATRLKIQGDGVENGIVFNETATTDDLKYTTNANQVLIPLDPTKDAVTYSFISNFSSTNPAQSNTDVLTFNYTRRNEYVSRACGFKTIYTLTSIERAGDEDANSYWISNISLFNPNVEFENETHVKIFF
ncbi:hypothetical protein GON26_10365 [Flavobacterium sp. GA093]|uniref:Lipoprotein n=1 Tax=Flavobacterium hydrocarbonoxydans TaxID=2683249 RepID=A0A6I4NSY2_9FLAO|nr:DUF6452 family protein [Flavobacterium hydrocarbonoxydans]MWB94769.1 hypothetical protein [Flavobacterium hydrocarbonoxydans]